MGEGGKVSLYNYAGSAHVIVDVAGWYGAEGSRFTPVAPSRILDTRTGVGAPAATVGPASTISLQVTGRAGVPAAGVSAVVLNVTVTQPTATSFLTAWPAGAARPLASNLNDVAGQTVPNLVIVKVGEGGQVNLYNHAGTAHLIADVAGWFGDGAESTFTALAPARILDTRTATKPGAASTLELQVTGRGGVPATGVSAVVLNVTVTEPTATSFLTAWPAGSARPLASNLNYVAGLTGAQPRRRQGGRRWQGQPLQLCRRGARHRRRGGLVRLRTATRPSPTRNVAVSVTDSWFGSPSTDPCSTVHAGVAPS